MFNVWYSYLAMLNFNLHFNLSMPTGHILPNCGTYKMNCWQVSHSSWISINLLTFSFVFRLISSVAILSGFSFPSKNLCDIWNCYLLPCIFVQDVRNILKNDVRTPNIYTFQDNNHLSTLETMFGHLALNKRFYCPYCISKHTHLSAM